MGAIAMIATAAILLGACAPDTPPPGPADSVVPKTPGASSSGDGVQHSPNARLVANVPLSAPFDGDQAWGTDLAFRGDHAYVGNYEGFTIHDISDPAHPKVVTRVVCPGGQNDISVSGNLVFLSVDEPRSDETCESDRGDAVSGWEGIRIFDVSDPAKPRYLKSVETQCGSHTHTLVPGKDAATVYLYVSSFGPAPDTAKCKPPHDSIAIVEVPVNDPAKARIIAQPVLFEDGADETGPGATSGCHDITVYPEKDLAAGACLGNGILMDISDRTKPKVLQQVTDAENFSIWHSATFTNDASKVIFSDELGGGIAPTCDLKAGADRGADAIYEIVDGRALRRTGAYYKIPRTQTGAENCVAHNGSLLPVPGKTIMVQAWYQGGVSVIDYTDPAKPKEIAYVDRGPLSGTEPRLGGSWSAYYYNGYVYSSDITKGLDVISVDDPLTNPAKQVKLDEFNAQTQVSYPE
ncbi:LVIVD repeat-containing protein [Sphaerisporangium aureirubrum]|uniref:LVIVD repeat-containing protein n=1 Tax=Sphaerisporangium aureirubrum TaxID=1544736 RepID=A0ABW1NGJ3_9ACTN